MSVQNLPEKPAAQPAPALDEATATVLTLSNDPGLLRPAVAFVGRLAEHYGLSYRAVGELEIAVTEAVANVIRHAFRPCEQGRFSIACQAVPGGVEVRVRDQGLPYEPDITEPAESQRGMHIMARNVDELGFLSLGHLGKEVRLLKLEGAHRPWDQVEAPKFQPESFSKEELIVRHMQPGDAIEVSRCFYDVYGYGYGSDTVYHPRRLIELNEAGLMRTLVAVTQEGYVLGTESLERSRVTSSIWEAGMAAVRPEARHFGVGRAMARFMEKMIVEEKVSGVWAACVTSHTYSQRTVPPGSRACVLTPGNRPPDSTLEESQSQRNSVLHLYLDLNRTPPRPTLYLPQGHEEICAKILEGFGWKPIYADPVPVQLEGITEGIYDASLEKGRIVGTIKRYGEDFESRGRERHNFFRTHGYLAIHVMLPLNHPYSIKAAKTLEGWGYFFGGVFPGTGHDDPFLVMNFLNNQILDYDKIEIEDPFGIELREYVRKLDPEQKAQ